MFLDFVIVFKRNRVPCNDMYIKSTLFHWSIIVTALKYYTTEHHVFFQWNLGTCYNCDVNHVCCNTSWLTAFSDHPVVIEMCAVLLSYSFLRIFFQWGKHIRPLWGLLNIRVSSDMWVLKVKSHMGKLLLWFNSWCLAKIKSKWKDNWVIIIS